MIRSEGINILVGLGAWVLLGLIAWVVGDAFSPRSGGKKQ